MLFLHVARSLLLPSIKALAHWLSAFGQASTPFHGCQPPKLKTKQNKKLSFPPTWSLYWLLSSKQPDPTFSYNLTDCFPQPHTPRKCTQGCQLVKQSPFALKTSRRCGKPKQAEEKKKKKILSFLRNLHLMLHSLMNRSNILEHIYTLVLYIHNSLWLSRYH